MLQYNDFLRFLEKANYSDFITKMYHHIKAIGGSPELENKRYTLYQIFMDGKPHNFFQMCKSFLDEVFIQSPTQSISGNNNNVFSNVQNTTILVNSNASQIQPIEASLYDYAIECILSANYTAVFDMLSENQNAVPIFKRNTLSTLKQEFYGGQYKYDVQYSGRLKSLLSDCNLKNTPYTPKRAVSQAHVEYHPKANSVENVNGNVIERASSMVEKFEKLIGNARKRILEVGVKTITNEAKFKAHSTLYSVWDIYNTEISKYLLDSFKITLEFKKYAPEFSIVSDSDYKQACDDITSVMEFNYVLIEKEITKVKGWLEKRVSKQGNTDDLRILRVFADKFASNDIEVYDLCKRFLSEAHNIKGRLIQSKLKSEFDEFLTCVSSIFESHSKGEIDNFTRTDFLLDLLEMPIVMSYFKSVQEYIS